MSTIPQDILDEIRQRSGPQTRPPVGQIPQDILSEIRTRAGLTRQPRRFAPSPTEPPELEGGRFLPTVTAGRRRTPSPFEAVPLPPGAQPVSERLGGPTVTHGVVRAPQPTGPGEPLVSDDPSLLPPPDPLQERRREWAIRNAIFSKDAILDIDYVPRDAHERVEMGRALTPRYMRERGLDRNRAMQAANVTLSRAKVTSDRERRDMGRLMEAVSVAAMRVAPVVDPRALDEQKKKEFVALQKAGTASGLPEINPAALRVMFDASVTYWSKRKEIVTAAQRVADLGPADFQLLTTAGRFLSGEWEPDWMKHVQGDHQRRLFLFALSQFTVAKKRTAGQKRAEAWTRGVVRLVGAPVQIRELYLGGDESKQLFIDTISKVMLSKDPITSESIWARGFYNAIGMTPLLLAAAATGGAAGVKTIGAKMLAAAPPVLVMSAAVAPDMYEDFLQAGIDSKVAKPMALAASLVEGVIEYAQLRGLTPGARLALGSRFAATVPGFIAKYFVGPYAREWTEEAAQELSRLMFKTLADAIDDGEIEVDFSAEVARSMGDMKEMTVSLFYLMGPAMVSAGVNVRSLWAAEQSEVQLDAVRKISEDAAAALDAREQEIWTPAPPAEVPPTVPEAAVEAPPAEAPAAPTEVAPEVSVPPAKQPWEMTQREFESAAERTTYGAFAYSKGETLPPVPLLPGEEQFVEGRDLSKIVIASTGKVREIGLANARKRFVQEAIDAGKPVPPEVLADYPDLAPTEAAPTEAPPEVPRAPKPKPVEEVWRKRKAAQVKAKITRARNVLERQIIKFHEDTIGPIEEAAQRAAAAAGEGEQIDVEFTTAFAGPIPTEVKEALSGRADLRMKLKGNVRGGLGEDYVSEVGGAAEYAERLKVLAGGKKGDIRRAIDTAEQTAKDIRDTEMLLAIQQYRALEGAEFGDIERVTAGDLDQGDTFEIGGEQYRVVRKAEGLVEVEDGVTGAVSEDATIPIDKGTLGEGPTGVAEQPWQMGEDDWEATLPAVTDSQRAEVATLMGLSAKELDDQLVRSELNLYPGGKDHYGHVVDAIARGETVPAEAKETYSDEDMKAAATEAMAGEPQRDLFGREIVRKATGAQRELPLEKARAEGLPAREEGAASPELVTAVARLAGKAGGPTTAADAYLALKAELKGEADALFAAPERWQGEMQDAWERATKGERLFPREPAVEPMGGPARLDLSTGPTGEALTTPHQIVRKMSELFGVPIRYKRFRGRARAIYKRLWAVVRLKGYADVAGATHEVAHHIYRRETLHRQLSKGLRAELKRLDYEPKKARLSEGWAEFMRMYLTTETEGQDRAPLTHQWLTRQWLPTSPWRPAIEQTRQLVSEWRKASSVERVIASMTRPKGLWGKLRGALSSPIPTIQRGWHMLLREEVNRMQALWDAQHAMAGTRRLDDIPPGLLFAPVAKIKTMAAAPVAREFVFTAARNWKGERVGPSLYDALAPIRDQLGKGRTVDEFEAFMKARHALDVHARDLEPGVDLEDAEFVVEQFENRPGFTDAADAVTAWHDSLLDYLMDAGGLTAEARARMRTAYPNYVPLLRDLSGEGARPGPGGAKLADLPMAVYRLKGADLPTFPPLEASIMYAERIIKIADGMRVMKMFIEAAEHYQTGQWIEKVTLKQAPVTMELRRVQRQLEDAGVSLERADLDAVLTVFQNVYRGSVRDNVVMVVRDGKVEAYQLHKDIYRAVAGLNAPFQLAPILDFFFGRPARMLRLFTTGIRASFGLVTNPMRDIPTRMMQRETGGVLSANPAMAYADYVLGVKDVIVKSEAADLWRGGGGEMAQPLAIDRKFTAKAIDELLARSPAQKWRNWAKHPIETVRKLVSIPEAANRVAEAEASLREQGWEPGQRLTIRQFINMQLASANATIDFREGGRFAMWVNRIVPFHNAQVQGPNRLVQKVRQKPYQLAMRGMLWLTLPTLANWWRYRDDEEYAQFPSWEKGIFWHVRLGDAWVRIPKPFEYGFLFATMPEAIAEWIYRGDPEQFEAEAGEFLDALIPPIIPTTLKVAAEVTAGEGGYDYFRDRPIVPRRLQRLRAEEQYDQYTTRAAIEIGALFKVSPLKVEHLVRGFTGGMGISILQAADEAAEAVGLAEQRGRRPRELRDIPVIGRLFITPRAARSINEFYDEYDDLSRNWATATARGGMMRGDLIRYRVMQDAAGKMSAIYKANREIIASERSDDDKRAELVANHKKLKRIVGDAKRRRAPERILSNAIHQASKTSTNENTWANLILSLRANGLNVERSVEILGKRYKRTRAQEAATNRLRERWEQMPSGPQRRRAAAQIPQRILSEIRRRAGLTHQPRP